MDRRSFLKIAGLGAAITVIKPGLSALIPRRSFTGPMDGPTLLLLDYRLNEICGKGYARLRTAAADWRKVFQVINGVEVPSVANKVPIQFPQAEGDWGTVVAAGLQFRGIDASNYFTHAEYVIKHDIIQFLPDSCVVWCLPTSKDLQDFSVLHNMCSK